MISGVGCDIVAINRFTDDKLESLAKRILTREEFETFQSLNEARKSEWLAGRFAAKEAVFKALKRAVPITRIAVLSTSDGVPYVLIDGFDIQLSISHDETSAIAVAIAEKH